MAAGLSEEVRARVAGLGGRYGNLVYGAALRQMGERGERRGREGVAEDVMQAVFLVALRKAKTGGLPEEGRMAGWLLKVTRYAVKEARRAERRRRRHEEAAGRERQEEGIGDSGAGYREDDALLAVLDEALLRLGGLDREVVVRRYLQGEAVEEVAAAVGLNENTASQRIGRALEKLRKALARRGVVAPAAGVVAVMMAESAKAAPAGVTAGAAGIVGGAGGASVAAVSIAKGAAAMMKVAMVKTVAGVVVAFAVVLLVVVTVSNRMVSAQNAPGQKPLTAAPISTKATSPAKAASTTAPSDLDADKLLDLALATIAKQQQDVKNLTASSTRKYEELDQKTGRWETPGELDVTVMFGPRAQEYRIDCRLDKTKWTNGPVPFALEHYTDVYDGKWTLELRHLDQTGMGDVTTGMWTCGIVAGHLDHFDQARWATGWAASTLGWKEPDGTKADGTETNGRPLLTVLAESRKVPGFRAEIVTETDRRLLKITAPRDGLPPEAKSFKLFWLDVDRAFALTRYEDRFTWAHDGLTRGLILSDFDVAGFTEPMNGVFFPKHVEGRSYTRAGDESAPTRRTTSDISEVKVNTALTDFDFDIKHVDMPENTAMWAEDTMMHALAGTPEERQKRFGELVDYAKSEIAKSQKAAATRPGATQPSPGGN